MRTNKFRTDIINQTKDQIIKIKKQLDKGNTMAIEAIRSLQHELEQLEYYLKTQIAKQK